MHSFLTAIVQNRLRTVLAVFAALALPLPLVWMAGAALVGLACLHFGMGAGLQIAAYAGLPAAGLLFLQGGASSVFAGHLLVVLWVAGLAAVLRESSAWERALLVNVAYIFLFAALLYILAGEQLVANWEQVRMVMQEAGARVPPELSKSSLVSGYAFGSGLLAILCLVVARYWQALLYNPGGFRQEFHSLRLPRATSVALSVPGVFLVVLGIFSPEGQDRQVWLSLAGYTLLLPHLFAGIGLGHALAGRLGAGNGKYLVLLYLLLLPRLGRLVLALLAAADSWLDFRSRYQPPAAPGGKKEDERDTTEE